MTPPSVTIVVAQLREEIAQLRAELEAHKADDSRHTGQPGGG